jgi:ribose 5-phosphate isomerase B
MKIFLGSDHAGFELKQHIAEILRKAGHDIKDFGDTEPSPEDDYPDFIVPVARAVAADPAARGIIFGGSGQGEAIAANRTAGIRAAVYYGGPHEILILSRQHNDANILSLAARFLSEAEAADAVKAWLETAFSGEERHVRRIQKLG